MIDNLNLEYSAKAIRFFAAHSKATIYDIVRYLREYEAIDDRQEEAILEMLDDKTF